MPRPPTPGLLILWLLTVLGGSPLLVFADDDDSRQNASRPTMSVKQKSGSVYLTPEQQSAAGLSSQMVSIVSLQNETTGFGKVLDIQPLLELRARLRAAQSDVDVASAALKLAEKNRQRI